GRRFTYDAFFIVGEIPGRLGGIFATYWLLFSVNIVIMFLLVYGSWKILSRNRFARWSATPDQREIPFYIVAVLTVIVVVVIGERGGLQRKPMNVVTAHVFAAPVLNNLVLNSTYTFIKSFGVESISREVYFSDHDEMLKYLNGGSEKGATAQSLMDGQRPKKPQNVVIIILESFSLEYMGQINGDKGYTPFLDQLSHKSLFFKNSFANARRSIEGVAAVMAGIPALMSEPFISSQFISNYFVGLGSMLGSHKYNTSFFHGGNNGTMHFDSFAKSAGLEHYYGANEYPNSADNDGTWGIFDEPFFQFMKTKLDESPKPFLAGVFSLSSHNPYRIPDQYREKFPKGPIEILETVGYADYALQRFFEEASKQPWYEDTLFVITADHTSLNFRPGYDNELSRYRVPILFFHPNYQWPQGIDPDQVVQQIDILPSIMDFLGFENKEVNYLSRSVFIPGERTATMYLDGRYLLAAKDHFLDWPKDGEIKMYDISDSILKQPLQEPATRKQELENRLKASIQYFNEAMWDNRLYYPSGR
ncbi:MAG: LTA synthase family protein, partial [Bdellovibrionaceae bacterium]|nr:LTA synthase family protein [Pseudobdellovibrionaceae bacterium]